MNQGVVELRPRKPRSRVSRIVLHLHFCVTKASGHCPNEQECLLCKAGAGNEVLCLAIVMRLWMPAD
jgi:hypothetical protein